MIKCVDMHKIAFCQIYIHIQYIPDNIVLYHLNTKHDNAHELDSTTTNNLSHFVVQCPYVRICYTTKHT